MIDLTKSGSDTIQRVTHRLSTLQGSRLFLFALLNGFYLNLVLFILSYVLIRLGWLPRDGFVNSLILAAVYWLHAAQRGDSWGPMLEALKATMAHLPVYDTVFFSNHTKFQYPLTSLLPLYALQSFGVTEAGMLRILNICSWLATFCTVALASFILVRSAEGSQSRVSRNAVNRIMLVLAGAVAGFTFIPIMWAYDLGQIQVFLTLAFTAAFYFWMSGKETASGLLIGLMILIKPQCALFLPWFLLRAKWKPFLACLAPVCISLFASLMLFGWQDHVRYLAVISYMSRHGEIYYWNFSVNGVLNRLLHNGNGLQFTLHSFPAYNPVVYGATLLSSCLFVAATLFYPLRTRVQGGIEDFTAVALSMTLASPIAWDHHYGILFPAFAYFAGRISDLKHVGLIGISYVLLSNSWYPLNVFGNTPLLNILQSLPFFGVLLFLFFLYLRMSEASSQPTNRSVSLHGHIVREHSLTPAVEGRART